MLGYDGLSCRELQHQEAEIKLMSSTRICSRATDIRRNLRHEARGQCATPTSIGKPDVLLDTLVRRPLLSQQGTLSFADFYSPRSKSRSAPKQATHLHPVPKERPIVLSSNPHRGTWSTLTSRNNLLLHERNTNLSGAEVQRPHLFPLRIPSCPGK